jgi:hypothetical protein
MIFEPVLYRFLMISIAGFHPYNHNNVQKGLQSNWGDQIVFAFILSNFYMK